MSVPVRSIVIAGVLLITSGARAQSEVHSIGTAFDAGSDVSARLSAIEARLGNQQADLDALTEHELAVESKEPALRFWGYMDMGVNRFLADKKSLISQISPTTGTTFVLGSVNLYLEAKPIAHFSAFLETRLTNLPDGTVSATGGLDSSQVWDFTSPSGAWATTRLGAIVLERAYLQWEQSDLLVLRLGEILTPFGIWNIDHGTPTLIP